MIDQHAEATDGFERFAADGKRGAKAVAHAAFEPARQEHAGLEVRSDAESFKPGSEGAVSAATIERGHQSHRAPLWIGFRWRRELRHHASEIVRRDRDVGIVDEQIVVTRQGSELGQGADLAVGAEALRALDESYGTGWKLALELLDRGCGGIVERRHAKEELELASVILTAMASKGVEHARIDALEGFEDGDAGREVLRTRNPLGEKDIGGDECGEEVGHSGHGERRRQPFDGLCDCVRHSLASLANGANQGSIRAKFRLPCFGSKRPRRRNCEPHGGVGVPLKIGGGFRTENRDSVLIRQMSMRRGWVSRAQ